MGLRNFHPAIKTVNGVTVRGVSLNDVAVLTEAYGRTLIKMFKLATDQDPTDGSAFGNVVGAAAREAPQLVANLIQMMIVDDDLERETVDEEVAKINMMTVGMQTELIEGIFANTFETDADIKKMVEAITRMLNKISTAVEQVPQLPTENTTSGSENK